MREEDILKSLAESYLLVERGVRSGPGATPTPGKPGWTTVNGLKRYWDGKGYKIAGPDPNHSGPLAAPLIYADDPAALKQREKESNISRDRAGNLAGQGIRGVMDFTKDRIKDTVQNVKGLAGGAADAADATARYLDRQGAAIQDGIRGDGKSTAADAARERQAQTPSFRSQLAGTVRGARDAVQNAPAAIGSAAQATSQAVQGGVQQAQNMAQQAQQAVTGAAGQVRDTVSGAAQQAQQAVQSATTPRETQATQQTQTQTQTQRPAQTAAKPTPKPKPKNNMTSKIGTDFSDVGGRLGAALRDTQNAIASEEFDLDAILDAMAVGLEEGRGLSGDKDDYQKMRDRNANAGHTPGNTYATAQRRMRSDLKRGQKKVPGAKPATPKHLTPAQELAHRTGMTKANLAAKHSGTAAGRRQIANNAMDAAERGTSGNRGS